MQNTALNHFLENIATLFSYFPNLFPQALVKGLSKSKTVPMIPTITSNGKMAGKFKTQV
jgi:hypothetical protein